MRVSKDDKLYDSVSVELARGFLFAPVSIRTDDPITSGWLCTGRPFGVTESLSEQTVTLDEVRIEFTD